MAGRPTKQGIDYFPMDVGFFSDVKIRKISRACGSQSASILICLLCNIYKDEGYYIVWDEDLPFVIADIVGVSEGAVKEVLIKALQVGFFDNTLYEKYHVLTSFGIQKRFLLATYKRKETELIPEYMINDVNNSINDGINSINDVNNAKDAGAMSQLLNKLKFQREQKQMDVSDDSLLYALQYLLSSIKEGWIFDNFSVTNINSKFNEIISQARNGSNRKTDTEPDESSAGIQSIVFGK